MLKRTKAAAGCVLITILACFAASSQVQLASAAKAASRFRLNIPGLERPDPLDCCFCGTNEVARAAAHQDNGHRFDLANTGGKLVLVSGRHFSLDNPPVDVREIDLDGLKQILASDPKNARPLLINFWATWCDGCREEFPDLVKIDNDYRDKISFISISLDDVAEIKTTVPAFLKEMNAKMPVVLLNVKDPEPAIHTVDATWDGALPATYLYDRDGKVVFKYFGAIKPAELRQAIDKQLGSKP
jgi:thiol-disulfide isomerase/thioredoxin